MTDKHVKILTVLNRAAWLIALLSITVVVVIVRSHFRSGAEISSLREAVTSGQKSIDAATKRETERDSALQQKLREIEVLKRRVQTPTQVVAALPTALPQLPLPITVSRSAALDSETNDGTNHSALLGTAGGATFGSVDANSERSGAVLGIPDTDLKPFFDKLQECREAMATADAFKRDLADMRGQLSEVTMERDLASRKPSMKNQWANVKRAAKWFVVGAGVGMALSRKL